MKLAIVVGLVPLAIIAVFLGGIVMLAGSAGISSAAAETQGGQPGICTLGGPASYADAYGVTRQLSTAQSSVLATITTTGQSLQVPLQGLVVGVAAALQESQLRNLANSNVPASLVFPNDGVGQDHASVGPFQQQVGMGWGTLDQLMHPDWQAKQFFTRLLQVPDWQAKSETDVAQAVQNSAFGDAYQKWVNAARQLVGAAAGAICGTGVGGGGRPAVVAAATRYLGTPYSWNGGNSHGPTLGDCAGGAAANDCHISGFDCSGLVLFAYAQAGLQLPHSAAAQYDAGPHVDRTQLQPGDLVFLATNPAQPSTIHHVAIWIGNDSMIQAPESGAVINVVAHPFDQAGFAHEYAGATRPALPGE